MPGGRLMYEDRQRIAAGLAAGHSYAEIARSLGRPRSTVSREVARNGGASRYRANVAQQATGWRARRKPGLHRPAPTASDTRGRDPRAVRDFEERFAGMMVQTGVPLMVAKVLASLFTAETGTYTAAELVALLQVSPASISKGVGWLTARALVRRERDGRHERYVIDDNIWYRTWQASIQSMAMWRDFAQEGAELLGVDSPSGARLHTTSQFFRLLGHDMAQSAEHWGRTLR